MSRKFFAIGAGLAALAVPAAGWAAEPTTTSTSTSSSTTSTSAPPMVVTCIQGITTTVPKGATNPAGYPYQEGPCDGEPKRTICLNGKKTIQVTRAEEDIIGEPYKLGPCPASSTPRFTG